MRKNKLLTFGILVLTLTLVTSTMVAGTYAKYTTSASASGTAVVAKWKADFKGNGAALSGTSFDLFGSTFSDAGVDGKKLAPGTSGSAIIEYDTSGSQVKREVKITLGATSNLANLTYLNFYVNTTNSKTGATPVAISALTSPTEGNALNTTYAANAAGTGSLYVIWEWPFSADATQDAADTIDGATPISVVMTVTGSAVQLDN